MNSEQLLKLHELAVEILPEIQDSVQRIEANAPITQNHYGAYLNLLTPFAQDRVKLLVMSVALGKAGANIEGVSAALRLLEN